MASKRKRTSSRRLVGRVLERRRAEGTPAEGGGPAENRLAELEARVDHLESLVEGLQDSLHRDLVRLEQAVERLQHDTAPGEMTRKLARHARERRI